MLSETAANFRHWLKKRLHSQYQELVSATEQIPGLHRVPQIFHIVTSTAILIRVGIGAAAKFIDSLEGFLRVISYWAAGSISIQLTEWIFFRHKDPETYDPAIWNNSELLPSGISALITLIVPFALVIPPMDQFWCLGPITVTTGDFGFEMVLVITPFIYYSLRKLQIEGFRNGR